MEKKLTKIIAEFELFFENKYIDDINMEQILQFCKILSNKKIGGNDEFNKEITINIISILKNKEDNINLKDSILIELITKSKLKISEADRKMYSEDFYLEDIDNTEIEYEMDEINNLLFESFEDYSNNRIVPIYLYLDIDSFINGFNKDKYILETFYQRKVVWSEKRKQSLIESIFSSIPIPQIFCYETKEQKIEIVDGKQRMTAIIDFVEDRIILDKNFKFTNLKNKKYSELDQVHKNFFLDYSLNLMKIPYKSNSEKFKLEIFEKLNTNSVVLNFQEIRNAIYNSKLNDKIKEICKDNKFINYFLPDEKLKRMENIEMIYRFLSLKNLVEIKEKEIKLNNYKGIKNEIDIYMTNWYKNLDEIEIKEEIGIVENIFEFSYNLFGDNGFRTFDTKTGKWRKSINRPMMETMLLILHSIDYSKYKLLLLQNKDKILQEIQNLFITDTPFKDSFLSSTSNEKNINLRMKKILGIFIKYV